MAVGSLVFLSKCLLEVGVGLLCNAVPLDGDAQFKRLAFCTSS